jgi:hypothetical protein
MTSKTLTETLRNAELQLLNRSIRQNPRLAAQLIADDFREFGKTGLLYDKASILALLASEQALSIAEDDFQAIPLGPEAALCTYISRTSQGRARRSSIWQWRAGRWQVVFHQGTPIPPA